MLEFPEACIRIAGAEAADGFHDHDVELLVDLVLITGGSGNPEFHFHDVLVVHPAESCADQILIVGGIAPEIEGTGGAFLVVQTAAFGLFIDHCILGSCKQLRQERLVVDAFGVGPEGHGQAAGIAGTVEADADFRFVLRPGVIHHIIQHSGITEAEAIRYISNRMELAGTSPRIFDDSAMLTAFGSCNASLRQLNLILTKALTIGAQNNKQNIDSEIILAAVNDIALI